MDIDSASINTLALWPPANSRQEKPAGDADPLPLPQLTIDQPKVSGFEYILTTICCHGQLSDRTPVRLLDWKPDQPVALVVKGRAAVGLANSRSTCRIGPRGHLRLPATVRHQCGVAAGQKLLVAVSVEHRIVIVYPVAAIDRALTSLHELARSAVQ